MAVMNLTKETVEHIAIPATRQEHRDGLLANFYLIVQPSGVKSFAIRYRFDGKPKKMTIGTFPKVSLKDARDAARAALALVEKGIDPNEEKKADDTTEDFLVKNVFEDFLKRHVEKNNSKGTASRRRNVWEAEIKPVWGERHIEDIKRRDVVKMLDVFIDRDADVMANRVFTFLRKFFNWCIDRDIITLSPMHRMKAPANEESRTRKLNAEELRVVWLAAEREGYPFGPIVQLLILTGQRQQEVGAAMRNEFGGAIEYGSNLPIWIIPKVRTKNKKDDHLVPLTEWTNDLFLSQPKLAYAEKDFLFTYTGKRACTAYSHAKQRIDELTLTILKEEAVARGDNPEEVKAIPHWTFHDLRRTAATGMARLKVKPHEVEAILNHKTGQVSGVAAIYNLYEYFEEKYEALSLWEAQVKQIISGATNVVPLFQQAAG